MKIVFHIFGHVRVDIGCKLFLCVMTYILGIRNFWLWVCFLYAYILSRMSRNFLNFLEWISEQVFWNSFQNKFSGCNELRAILFPVFGNVYHVTYNAYTKISQSKKLTTYNVYIFALRNFCICVYFTWSFLTY